MYQTIFNIQVIFYFLSEFVTLKIKIVLTVIVWLLLLLLLITILYLYYFTEFTMAYCITTTVLQAKVLTCLLLAFC